MKTPYIPLHKHFDMRRCTAAPFRFAFFFFLEEGKVPHEANTLFSFPLPLPRRENTGALQTIASLKEEPVHPSAWSAAALASEQQSDAHHDSASLIRCCQKSPRSLPCPLPPPTGSV